MQGNVTVERSKPKEFRLYVYLLVHLAMMRVVALMMMIVTDRINVQNIIL